MLFALGVSVGCVVGVLLIFTLAKVTQQKPTSFMVQAHQQTLDLLKEANRLRAYQVAALDKIEARLASHNNERDEIAALISNAIGCIEGGALKCAVDSLNQATRQLSPVS
jgi:uncharacterized membrane protein required for colicin V production